MIGNILDYCTISGESVKKYEGRKRYVATGDVIENKIINSSEVDYMNKPSRANQIAKEGDVIFAKMKDTKKVMKIDKENSEYIYSTGFYIIKPNEGILTDYMYWLFNSTKFNRDKDKHCKGATQKALNSEGLRKIKINKIPNLEEQQKIVSKLSKIDKIMNKKKKQLMMLDELIKSQFVEMFGDIHLNDKKWEKFVKMNEICEINPKKSEISDLRNIMVSFVPMQSVTEDGKIYTDDKRNINDVKSGFTYFRENDVLFAKITPCMENGKGAIAVNLENKIGFGSTEFHVIRPGKYVNPLWIYTLTATKEFRKQAEMSMTGSAGQKRVSSKYLENYRIGVPPITLQNKFSEIVKQIDKQKFEIEKSLKETQELYESLMEKYFG